MLSTDKILEKWDAAEVFEKISEGGAKKRRMKMAKIDKNSEKPEKKLEEM